MIIFQSVKNDFDTFLLHSKTDIKNSKTVADPVKQYCQNIFLININTSNTSNTFRSALIGKSYHCENNLSIFERKMNG